MNFSTDFSWQFLNLLICIFVCSGLTYIISRTCSPMLARFSVKTRIPPIFYLIGLFFICLYLGKISYSYLTEFQHFCKSRGAYLYETIALYWSIGIPAVICFGYLGVFKISQAMVDDYIKEQQDQKDLIESHNAKSMGTVEDVRKALKTNIMTGVNVTGAHRNLWSQKGHAFTCGYARSQKGTSILIPIFLHEDLKKEDAPSFVCLDPKGENVAVCAKNLSENGYNVLVINPFHIPAIAHLPNHHYNPFDHFEAGQIDFGSQVNLIVNSIIPPDKQRHANSYFSDAAHRILSIYVKHLMTQDIEAKTIKTLHRWLKYSDDKRGELWDRMAENNRYDIDIDIENLAHKMADGVKSTNEVFENILANMRCFTEDVIRDSMSDSDFSIRQLVHQKTAVFICMQPDDLKDYAAWVRIIISSFMRTLSREPSSNRKIAFVMDEFPTLGYMREFEEGVGYLGQFVSLWPVVQDLGQMKSLYPNMWEGFVGNAAIKHWMVRDNFTAQYLEKRMPMTLQFLGKNPDGSPRYKEKPLMTAVEIMNCEDIIMEIEGMGKPALLTKKPYYKHFSNFTPNPYYRSTSNLG